MTTEQLEDHVLGADPVGQSPGQLHPPDLRHGQIEGFARHRHGDLESADAHREHPKGPGRGGVAIGARKCLSRNAEALHVDRMTHSVPRFRVPDPEALARAVKEHMVIRVPLVGLEKVVIDVLSGELCANAVELHSFEFEHHQGPRRVLSQGLVDEQTDLRARGRLAGDQVVFDQLLSDAPTHGTSCCQRELPCISSTKPCSLSERRTG